MENNEFLEEELVRILKDNKLKLTTVESCTGGMIASRIVNVAGASTVFEQGFVTYSESAKVSLVGVKADTIDKYNVVSHEVAYEMAEGGAHTAGADMALSVTGIAGPDGGSEERPVGLCYIGCYYNDNTQVEKHIFTGDRLEIRKKAANAALMLGINCIKGNPISPE